jgi:putative ABC transport system permease protein
MEQLWQDFRYGIRMLAKSPGMTAVVVVTLALGICANAVIFSIVSGFLRPLPVRAPEQLVVVATQQKDSPIFMNRMSYPELVDFRKQSNSFSDLIAYTVTLMGLSYEGKADQFVVSYVTGNYFSTLGVKPAAGRLFLPKEGEAGDDSPYLVLGYAYWQKRFGGDPGIVGKQMLVNGKAATIIGVAQEGFRGVYSMVPMDGYVPLSRAVALGDSPSDANFMTDRGNRFLKVLGRLKPGVSLKQAQSSSSAIAATLAEEYPATDKGVSVHVMPERLARPEAMPNNLVPIIAVGLFLFLAGLLLVLACLNVANILLVRATVRQQEMGIRVAMGAGRIRLARQVLTETGLLALLGGVAGILLAIWSSPGLVESSKLGGGIPIRMDFSFDWRVFAYAAGAMVFTGIVVGLWPAWRAARADVNTILREGGRTGAGAERHRMRDFLVVAQVAGSLMLLIVAGLFARSLKKAQQMYLGFQPDHLLNVTVYPREIGYDEARTNEFYRELKERVRALPGVQSVNVAFAVPMSGAAGVDNIYVEGHPTPAGQQPPVVFNNSVDEDYFATTRVPLLRGRALQESDDANAPQVAIVNQSMASRFWPNEDPIGKRFSLKSASGPFLQVVGIAADGKYLFIAEPPQPYFYRPLTQNYMAFRTLQIRTSVAPESLIAPVEKEISSLAPDLPIFNAETMEQQLEGANGFMVFREGAERAAQMGFLGLLLAVVGVFGVVSYAAAQRTHEIGIRMALGADRRDILRLVLGQGVRLVAIGVGVGVAAAWALTRAMGKLLIGVSSTDPFTYLVAVGILAAIALLACYIPARRASKVEPLVALRYE